MSSTISFLLQSNQDELQNAMQGLANEFDLDIDASATSMYVTQDYLLTLMPRDKRGQDHIMPLKWRVTEFMKRVLAVLATSDNLQVGLAANTSLAFYIQSIPKPPTIEQVMASAKWEPYLHTTTGPLVRAVIALRIREKIA